MTLNNQAENIVSIGIGREAGYLTNNEMQEVFSTGLNSLELNGKRVLVIIPDSTRTMPMPQAFDMFEQNLVLRVKKLDYLVALGTHQPLDDSQLSRLVGRTVTNGKTGETGIFNHYWQKAAIFADIGCISAEDIAQITHGLLSQAVPVQINRLIFDYDQLIICGPVFPHEVAGFSGGNKYLFPGIAGPEIINFTHWLGALITSYKIIGTAITPVRIVIDRAAALLNIPTACFSFVVDRHGVAGLYFGTALDAWSQASRLSSLRHIVYKPRTYQQVLSIMPSMYTDLWTAAKGMYKLEPVVADGGQVIIFAPHIYEVSYTHGMLLDEIGYHCRDYFLAQWERYKGYPGGVLAHSTHLTGLGEYDSDTGVETPRIRVTLATGIPEERCRRINLGYRDPAAIDIHAWQNREDEGILVVPDAGEMLYRLKE